MKNFWLLIDESNDKIISVGQQKMKQDGHRTVKLKDITISGDAMPSDPFRMIGTLTVGGVYSHVAEPKTRDQLIKEGLAKINPNTKYDSLTATEKWLAFNIGTEKTNAEIQTYIDAV